MSLTLQLADKAGLAWAQEQVTLHHYLHKPVDSRCSILAYLVMFGNARVGCLMFGRPEAQRCLGWYGSVQDVARGVCRLTRWQILNLARVWLHPSIQFGGEQFIPNAATTTIAQALRRVGFDYLAARPPCFLDEPYEIRECLSYCDSRIHTGTLYRAANFTLVRENERGIQTYVRPLRRLTNTERTRIIRISETNERSKRYRTMRAVANYQQATLFA